MTSLAFTVRPFNLMDRAAFGGAEEFPNGDIPLAIEPAGVDGDWILVLGRQGATFMFFGDDEVNDCGGWMHGCTGKADEGFATPAEAMAVAMSFLSKLGLLAPQPVPFPTYERIASALRATGFVPGNQPRG